MNKIFLPINTSRTIQTTYDPYNRGTILIGAWYDQLTQKSYAYNDTVVPYRLEVRNEGDDNNFGISIGDQLTPNIEWRNGVTIFANNGYRQNLTGSYPVLAEGARERYIRVELTTEGVFEIPLGYNNCNILISSERNAHIQIDAEKYPVGFNFTITHVDYPFGEAKMYTLWFKLVRTQATEIYFRYNRTDTVYSYELTETDSNLAESGAPALYDWMTVFIRKIAQNDTTEYWEVTKGRMNRIFF